MRIHATYVFITAGVIAGVLGMYGAEHVPQLSLGYQRGGEHTTIIKEPTLDRVAYDVKLLELAHVATSSPFGQYFLGVSTTSPTTTPLWPVKTTYPAYGALVPEHRIVAYYGNFLSKYMGILGEYPDDELVRRLLAEKEKWEAADPKTPVIPAIDYIAITAQNAPGDDGMYRAHMPERDIERAILLAKKVDGIVILEVQVGLSTLQKELPLLQKYLVRPEVHLALDPEFSMKTGARPGTVIGTFDAEDINYAVGYLSTLTQLHHIPPKILLVHRFTENMVTNYEDITPSKEVQIIMVMDGWGSAQLKKNTYYRVINPEPVQFTGIKLFYKNDLKPPSTGLITTDEVLNLTPQPIFIQYQ